jgi:hypothetical protein
MNKNILKLISYIFSLTILFFFGRSCSKVIELPIPENEDIIVVESLFSPDNQWQVNLYKLFTGYDPIIRVEGALIYILDEYSDTLYLEESSPGYYTNSEYPKIDHIYTLFVKHGDIELSASSRIPPLSEITQFRIIANPPHNSTADLYIGNHAMTSFSVQPKTSTGYSRLRILVFDNDYSYKYHVIDQTIQKKLETILSNEEYYAISDLFGDTIYGNNMKSFLTDRLWELGLFDNIDTIVSLSYQGELNYKHPEAFDLGLCYSPNNQYYQNYYESMTLLGFFNNNFTSEVYFKQGLILNKDTTREIYLEYIDLNADYYNYQRDYILQITNRFNLSESPIIVFSNIENGTGIFAGYQRRLFRLDQNSSSVQ